MREIAIEMTGRERNHAQRFTRLAKICPHSKQHLTLAGQRSRHRERAQAPRGPGARLAFVTGARDAEPKLPRRSAQIIGPGRGGGCFQILLKP